VIPPALSAAFVAAMEEILAVYARAVDPRFPLVCFDEGGKELVSHLVPPLPAAPGRVAREDTAYRRGGAANLFLACAPYLGWRQVQVTAQRTAVDFAHALRELVDQAFPQVERIVLVTDNLNTHTPAALYHTFPAPEARRILERIEWHYTPKHGSWLNMAELELSALARQCLARRIPDRPSLEQEVAAWVAERNQEEVRLAWRFGIDDARVLLAHCYPIPEQDTSAVSVYSG
jgi:DDE superfamily endonuclease